MQYLDAATEKTTHFTHTLTPMGTNTNDKQERSTLVFDASSSSFRGGSSLYFVFLGVGVNIDSVLIDEEIVVLFVHRGVQ